ncbi:hypothetical protein MGWOODY_XGa2061 [hydrothermal vent metagenome]|uniref:Uncharacterized protein n=1 Tax=hydrothermal vent metagenome TaxID=652676 RepID=A0A160TWH7_9ZZZZ
MTAASVIESDYADSSWQGIRSKHLHNALPVFTYCFTELVAHD